MSADTFLQRRILELEDETKRLRETVKWLTIALAEASAGETHDVSAAQFSMLVGEQYQ